jgi:hypothetical protein
VAIHQRALGLLNDRTMGERGLQLVGQPTLDMSGGGAAE